MKKVAMRDFYNTFPSAKDKELMALPIWALQFQSETVWKDPVI